MNPPVILLALANDAQHSLRLAEEERSIRETVASFHDRDLLEFHSIGHTTMADIYSSLNRFHNRIAVFHFAGHSDGVSLQLEDRLAERESLGTLLGMAPDLKLVFLNGCSNAKQVQTLHKAGVEVVIATSNDIKDESAKDFAHQFYMAMISGKDIKDSFQTACTYLRSHGYSFTAVQQRGISRQPTDNRFPWGLYFLNEEIINWKFPNPQQLAETIKQSTDTTRLTNFQLDGTVKQSPYDLSTSKPAASVIQLETNDRRVQNSQGVFRIEGEVLLGRGPVCNIVILEKGVSRKHARFVVEEGQLILLDENSTNGTYWNHVRVSRLPITQNGILSIHDVKFRVNIIK